MLDVIENNTPCWYAIYTKPKQEDRANFNLMAWNVEAFTPKFKESRLNAVTGKRNYAIKHLFPRYIFARFRASELLHKVYFTRGVHSVVSFGGTPCQVSDDIIELIRARMSEDGFVRIGEELTPGDKVIIDNGSLKNFAGIFEGKVGNRDKIVILLTAVHSQKRVVIKQDWVRKVG